MSEASAIASSWEGGKETPPCADQGLRNCLKLKPSKGKGLAQVTQLARSRAGVTPGSAVSLPLPDPPPLYLDPGLSARLTPRGRHTVLFSLQRTGWGSLAMAVADLLHPGWAHFITKKARPGLAASAAWGKLCFANTEPPESLSQILCKHPEHSSSSQQQGYSCLGALPLSGQLLGSLEPGGPGRGCSGGALPSIPYCPIMATVSGDEQKNYYSKLLRLSLRKYFLT